MNLTRLPRKAPGEGSAAQASAGRNRLHQFLPKFTRGGATTAPKFLPDTSPTVSCLRCAAPLLAEPAAARDVHDYDGI